MGAQPLVISHSEMRTWARCKRQWYLAYYRKLRLRTESPTGVVHIGSHIHLALEGYHGYGLDPITVLRWSYDDVIEARPEHEAQLRKDYDLAAAMIEGYLAWASSEGIDAGLKVVATEHQVDHQVELPLSGDVVLWRGKLDVLLQREMDQRYQLRDYKTVGGFGKANALLLDTQMRFYSMLLAFAYPDAKDRATEVLYLMIKRSKRTARATPPFYEQVSVSYNRHDLNSTYQRAVAISEEILAARRLLDLSMTQRYTGDHHYTCYPSPSDFCTWGCVFYDVCHLLDDGSRADDALSANYEAADPYLYYDTSRIRRAVAALGGGMA
jgi:PD-(D/E)XK nuclease superfamily